MEAPFFSSSLPMMLNIAAYGMVAGHELTHGFDNNGRLYNVRRSSSGFLLFPSLHSALHDNCNPSQSHLPVAFVCGFYDGFAPVVFHLNATGL